MKAASRWCRAAVSARRAISASRSPAACRIWRRRSSASGVCWPWRRGGKDRLRRDGLAAPRGPAGRTPSRLRRVRHLRRISRLEMALAVYVHAPALAWGFWVETSGQICSAHAARDSPAPARGRGRVPGRLSRSLTWSLFFIRPELTRTGSVGARGAAARDQSRGLRCPAPASPAPAPQGSLTNSQSPHRRIRALSRFLRTVPR